MLPRKKRKHTRSVIDNINLYIAYVKKYNPKIVTRKELVEKAGIKRSTINYLIKVLKQKKLIKLKGEVGTLYLVPTINDEDEDESI